MSEKKFDKFFIANLKRTAQMVSPAIREKQKLQADIAVKQERIAALDAQIEALDSHIRRECGFGVEELVVRNVIDTGKTDKEGRPVKVTKWELRYPETVVPAEEHSECIQHIEVEEKEEAEPEPSEAEKQLGEAKAEIEALKAKLGEGESQKIDGQDNEKPAADKDRALKYEFEDRDAFGCKIHKQ